MLKDLEEKQVAKASEINTGLGGNREVLKKKYYHLIILVRNQMGLKNLYKIVSEAHVNYFFKKPRVPRGMARTLLSIIAAILRGFFTTTS